MWSCWDVSPCCGSLAIHVRRRFDLVMLCACTLFLACLYIVALFHFVNMGWLGAQTPVRCNANGHYYLSVSNSTNMYTFYDALNIASSKWHNFNAGYLATITTDDERACVRAMMFNGGQWIGGIDYYSEGTFRWIDGPEAGTPITSFWDNFEPGGGSSENCIMLVSYGLYHDYSCTWLLPAFLVEFDGETLDACMSLI
jgi:hypothetical protein